MYYWGMHPASRLRTVAGRLEACLAGGSLLDAMDALSEADFLAVFADIAEGRKAVDLIESMATASAERRSDPSLGLEGLAKKTGHRNATALVQQLTGSTFAQVKKNLQAGADIAAVSVSPPLSGVIPWFEPLTAATLAGALSSDRVSAIRRGLGEPPIDRYMDVDADVLREIWRAAASQLVEEACDQTVESLLQSARTARDLIDPRGVALRFEERYRRRALHLRVKDDGQHGASITFDDEGIALMKAIMSAALRPRRGPRFVPSGADGESERAGSGGDAGSGGGAGSGGCEASRTGECADDRCEPCAGAEAAARAALDERSLAQLQYDTLMAILRTGAFADPDQSFGDRQPGVRITVAAADLSADAQSDESGNPLGTVAGEGYILDRNQAIPRFVVDKKLCDTGFRELTFDTAGRPLDVGREQRLFTAKQREMLRMRDGGCMWPGCDAPASWAEAHHINHWSKNGRTDIADGILLCQACHLRLHNFRWRITRDDFGFLLHPPAGTPRVGAMAVGREAVAPGEHGLGLEGDTPPPIRLRTKSRRRFNPLAESLRAAMADFERARAAAGVARQTDHALAG